MLTERRKRFIDAMVETGNQTESAKRAYGNSQRVAEMNGSRLMRVDEVRDAVEARRRAAAELANVSIASVIKTTAEAVQTALEQDEDGNPRDLPSALRGLKLLGDHVDAWAAGKAAPAQHLHLESLTFDQLKQLASGDPE